VPDRRAEPLDEMRASLADLEEEPGVPLGGLEALRPDRPGRAVLEAYALPEPLQGLVGR
jgi:hypothetical protein